MNKHQTPLLLLHGALGCKKQFEALQNVISKERTIFSLDFEGHGQIPSGKYFSMELFSENILAFLNENNIEKADVFGYSMGGYAALCLARKHPERLGNIMTLGTKFHWSPEIADGEIKKLDPEKIEEKVPAFAKRLEELHPANNWKTVVLKTAKMMRGLGIENNLPAEDLKKIPNRSLISLGALDSMVSVEESENTTKLLPNAKFKLLPAVKHPIETVDTSILAGEIERFLNEN